MICRFLTQSLRNSSIFTCRVRCCDSVFASMRDQESFSICLCEHTLVGACVLSTVSSELCLNFLSCRHVTTAYLVKQREDLGGSHSFHGQSFCVSPRLHQSPVSSHEAALPQPKSSISARQHHPCEGILIVNLSLCHMSIAHVANSWLWQQNVALSINFLSNGNSATITPEKHRMTAVCRNLGICHAFIQSWDIALSISIFSDCNSAAITAERHCMPQSCRNLGIPHFLIQRWEVALSMCIISYYLRWQQHTHHSGEALHDHRPQKPLLEGSLICWWSTCSSAYN